MPNGHVLLYAERHRFRSPERPVEEASESKGVAASKLRAELARKDRALQDAEAKMEMLKARVAESQRRAARPDTRGPVKSSQKSFESKKSLEESKISLPSQASQALSAVSSVVALENDLSGMLLRAASIESSWEQSAVRESLEILNLQLEDLPEFLSDAENLERFASFSSPSQASKSHLRLGSVQKRRGRRTRRRRRRGQNERRPPHHLPLTSI